MKQFKFTMLIGKKIIYQSILSFTKEQEEEYLQKILSMGIEKIGGELQVVISKTIGEKKYMKEFDTWENMTLEEYNEKYPEMLICASVQESIYDDCPFDSSSANFKVSLDGLTEEVEINELENYSWSCVYLRD